MNDRGLLSSFLKRELMLWGLWHAVRPKCLRCVLTLILCNMILLHCLRLIHANDTCRRGHHATGHRLLQNRSSRCCWLTNVLHVISHVVVHGLSE